MSTAAAKMPAGVKKDKKVAAAKADKTAKKPAVVATKAAAAKAVAAPAAAVNKPVVKNGPSAVIYIGQ